jgi:eukaryotic-like serine/threonine-protein kinase
MEERTVGPYKLLEQLGSGGMGEVYRALDSRIGREVAIKILPEATADDSERRRRFEQEARFAASLNHPNIMAIYDVGLDRHPPYLVAELVPGDSLRALVAKGPVAVRKAVDIAAQIAAGLSAAHISGIVHRDLKPENVIVKPDGTVKILDFGVARVRIKAPEKAGETATMGATVAGMVVGTAAYMSPEQARAEEVDHRSDQFSLGLVLYEMLSGRPAFERPSAVQTMSAIVEDSPPPLERPVPPQVRWILDRCLAKDREERYESTRDLARELAQVRDHFDEMTTTATATAQRPAASVRRRGFPKPIAYALTGAIIAWCAATLPGWRHSVDLSKYRLTPFATELTMQMYPAWSPDGKSLAFLGLAESGRTELFVQGLKAATAVDISGRDVSVNTGSAPFWSPDSRWVYFRCVIGSQGAALCRIPAGGGSSTMVQPDVQSASISPDGKTLVMWPGKPGKDRAGVWVASPPEAPARRYEPAPFQATLWYNNPTVAFSPDGTKILLSIALDSLGEASWILPWPQGKARRVFDSVGANAFAYTPQSSWMPDSLHLIFAARTASTPSQLYMADTGNGRYAPVLAQDRPTLNPTVSPDGGSLAYASALSHADVIEVPLGEGPVRTLLGSSRNEERVDTSRVGPQIVFVTDRRGVQEVWIKSLTENWERPLLTPSDFGAETDPALAFMNPVFSRDGRRVAVAVKNRSGIRVYTMFVAGGGTPVRATSSTEGLETCATWSPDGNWLAISAVIGSEPKLVKVRPGSGEPPVDLGPYYGSAVPVWSPDGAWIADHRMDGTLVIVNPDTKEARALPGDEGPVAWSRDGRTLYQVRKQTPSLVAVDIASGKQRKLRDLPDLAPFSNGNPGLSAAITWDEKSIVYTVNRPRQEIWILSGLQIPPPWYRRLLGR